MKTTGLVAVLALLFSLALGIVAGSEVPGLRPSALAVAISQSWYESLPIEPTQATNAYLELIPAETRERSRVVSDGWFPIFGMRLGVAIASVALILFSGCSAWMRDLSQRVSRVQPVQDAVYALQLFGVLFLLNLPLSTVAGFARRRRFGFSDMPFPAWLADTALKWAILTFFGTICAVLIFAFIRRRPQTWTRWALAVYVALTAFQIYIAPAYIEPLFNRIEPMADSPLKRNILSLARANGVAEANVFVSNASRQSKLLNAHVSGIGSTTKIVLNDTTVADASPAAVKFVMAHEIGHYVLGHAGKWLVFNGLVMAVGFAFIAWGARRLLQRFGARWRLAGLSDIGALPLIWLLFVVFGYMSTPVNCWFSRMQETEADLYGLNASQEPLGLPEFLLHDADSYPFDPSPILIAMFYDHPTPASRINTAMRWRTEHPTKQREAASSQLNAN